MNMLHPEFETLSSAEVRRLQDESWRHQWNYVRHNSGFYQKKLGNITSRDDIFLDNLEELPFTYKDELRISQELQNPFGNHLACPEDQLVRMQMTSGTTGNPLILSNTKNDLAWISRVGGRAFFAAGLRPGDRVVHCLNYCLWTGGLTDHLNLENTGACVVPFGVGKVDQLIDTIIKFGITAISCTPSYPALLQHRLAERKIDPRDLGLKLGLFGGEAGLDNLEFRQRLEQTWGFGVRNANYGMSEVLSIFAGQTEISSDLHFHGSDVVFAELIDSSGARITIAEGNTGELVCTHLRKESQPLIRYRTGDVITITGTDIAECGRTTWRFRVTGRSDDMFTVRGINIFPTAVQKAIYSLPTMSSGQFRIRLKNTGPLDFIDLRVEAAEHLNQEEFVSATQALEEMIKKQTGASAVVELVPFGSLPRTSEKTQLIERL